MWYHKNHAILIVVFIEEQDWVIPSIIDMSEAQNWFPVLVRLCW